MFGNFGLPNLDEMTKMVADFQVRHERMVAAMERLEAKLDLIIVHLGVDIPANVNAYNPVEVIQHDDGN